jgi:hypothetical protein
MAGESRATISLPITGAIFLRLNEIIMIGWPMARILASP